MSRLADLEQLSASFKHHPHEHILKTDLLTVGIAPGDGLPDVPDVVRLQGGPLGLRRTLVRVVVDRQSSYTLKNQGAGSESPLILEDADTGDVIAPAWPFPEDPPYAKLRLEDGSSYASIVSPLGVAVLPPKGGDPSLIGRVAAEMYFQSDWSPREAPVALRLVDEGGEGSKAGGDPEFYLQHIRAIRERIGRRVTLQLQAPPQPKEIEQELHLAGVDGRLSDMGTLDPELFEAVRPVGFRETGYDQALMGILDQTVVYGIGAITLGFVVGLEMTRPWGAMGLGGAVDSASAWAKFLVEHQVIPRPIHIRTHPLAQQAQGTLPPTEFFLASDHELYHSWVRNQSDEPHGFRMGPGRSRYPDSGVFDLSRGGWLGGFPPLELEAMEARG